MDFKLAVPSAVNAVIAVLIWQHGGDMAAIGLLNAVGAIAGGLLSIDRLAAWLFGRE